MREISIKDVGILFVVSLFVGLIFSIYFPSSLINEGDQFQYNTIANNINIHNVFSIETTPPFNSTLNREPLYPLFLSLIYRIFGGSFSVVRMIQVLIFALTIILIYMLILILTNNKIAFYSSLFTAICPPLANQTAYLLSETFFLFLLIIFIYLFTMMMSLRTSKLFIFCGVMLGLLTLCKALMIYFLPFLILGIIILKQGKGIFYPVFLVVVSFLIILMPWLYRNHYLFNTWKITAQRSGMVLNIRAMKISYDENDYKNAAVYYFSEELGKIIYPGATIRSKAIMNQFNAVVEGMEDKDYWRDVLKGKNFTLREGTIVDIKSQKLKKDGLSEIEIDRILTDEALRKIKAGPFKYLLQTPLELIKMTTFTYLPLLNEEYVISRINWANKKLLFLLRSITRLIAYPILGLAFYGIYQYRSRWKDSLPGLFIIIFFNLFYGSTFGDARYAAPLIPFYIMFATMGWFKLREPKISIS